MDIYEHIKALKNATAQLRATTSAKRRELLCRFAQSIRVSSDLILLANQKDLDAASSLSIAIKERLSLDEKAIIALANSVDEIADLQDPVGRILCGYKAPSGIHIQRITVPLGVVAIIYESRPNVTSDTTALCLKSANGIVLKGGKEAHHTNEAIVRALRYALSAMELPQELVFFTSDRHAAKEVLQMNDCIDVVIPRGSEELVSFVLQNSKIPVIKHDKGVCHIYIHTEADLVKSADIILNAKIQRPSACNAVETLLVDSAIFEEFLSFLRPSFDAHEVDVFACPKAMAIFENAQPVNPQSYFTEYGRRCVNIRVVEDIAEAIEHINHFGSHHSDAILTDNYSAAETFLQEVDSACVYVNASTRFSDGGQFGFGAEMGIATSKLHARGPMGLDELTTYKYIIRGQGNVRM